MSRFYGENAVEDVKAATDLVDLIGAHTQLRQVGNRYTGLCPFHKEDTPSFSVNPDKGFYYCFGCQASGDAISFVQQTERVDFTEALERLAKRAGITLQPRGATQDGPRRATPFDTLRLAQRFYQRVLEKASYAQVARDYLKRRGITEGEARHFGLGFAPPSFDKLHDFLSKKGVPLDLMLDTGLVRQSDRGGAYDVFRGRLMFPIHDAKGAVVGFAGRVVDDTLEHLNAPKAKYVNTSENKLFKKGELLFHLHQARRAARQSQQLVLVEGYTDVMALYRAGIAEGVAAMGTALTTEQAQLLARQAPVVVLAYDQDRAGQAAMHKNALPLLEEGVDVRVMALPAGQDPDELLAKEGEGGVKKRLAAAQPYLLHRLSSALTGEEGKDPAFQMALQNELIALTAKVKNPLLQQAVIKEMTARLSLADEKALRRQLFTLLKRQEKDRKNQGKPAPRGTRGYGHQGVLLGSAIRDPAAFALLRDVPPELLTDKTHRAVFQALRALPSHADIEKLVADSRGSTQNPVSSFVKRVLADQETILDETVFRGSLSALQQASKGDRARAFDEAFQRKTRQPPAHP